MRNRRGIFALGRSLWTIGYVPYILIVFRFHPCCVSVRMEAFYYFFFCYSKIRLLVYLFLVSFDWFLKWRFTIQNFWIFKNDIFFNQLYIFFITHTCRYFDNSTSTNQLFDEDLSDYIKFLLPAKKHTVHSMYSTIYFYFNTFLYFIHLFISHNLWRVRENYNLSTSPSTLVNSVFFSHSLSLLYFLVISKIKSQEFLIIWQCWIYTISKQFN